MCPNFLLFRCFHFRFTFEFIEEVGSASNFMSSYNLLDKIIAYMKDKGGNLSTLVKTFILVFQLWSLGTCNSLAGLCFGHAFIKMC